MDRKMKRTITVSLTEEQHRYLHILAEESCRTMSGYLRHLLIERIWAENQNRPDEGIGPYMVRGTKQPKPKRQGKREAR